MSLSMIEKTEIMHRTKAMRDDELTHMLKFIPTSAIMDELTRRSNKITDTLTAMCCVWDDLTVNKNILDMTIEEKEELLKSLRRALFYGE